MDDTAGCSRLDDNYFGNLKFHFEVENEPILGQKQPFMTFRVKNLSKAISQPKDQK